MASLTSRHPEISTEVIEPPVVIIGFPRTGTTHLHNLLSKDRAFRPLYQMDAMYPVNMKWRARFEMWVQDKVQDFLNPGGEIKAAHFNDVWAGTAPSSHHPIAPPPHHPTAPSSRRPAAPPPRRPLSARQSMRTCSACSGYMRNKR